MWRTVVCVTLVVVIGAVHGSFVKNLVRRDAKDSGHNWSYEDKTGPDHWPNMFKSCGGSRQSPVNIDTNDVDSNEDLNEFEFENYDDDIDDAVMENNGHTVVVTAGAKDAVPMIEEGGMDDSFKFLQIHFHWGSDSKKGSEHKIDGKSFPLEMHLVHMNTKYKTLEAALQKEDGLAVLAVLFKLDSEDNDDFDVIIDKLEKVKKEGDKVELDDFKLEDLLPDDLMPYYRYEGSLTTPKCNEVVTWTVFKDLVPISESQLQQFRSLSEDDVGEASEPLVDNFRSVQELHGRIIEISGEGNAATAPVASFLIVAMAALLASRL